MRSILGPLAVAALVFAACVSETDPAVDTTAATTATPAPAPRAPINVDLAAVNNSGVSGTGRLEHIGDSIRVTLSMNGLAAGTTYPAHVHGGTCASGGGRIQSIQPLSLTATNAQSTVTFSRDLLNAAGQQYFLQVHGANGAPIACGDVPAGFQSPASP